MNSAFLRNISFIDPLGQQHLAVERYVKMSFKTFTLF